VYFGLLLCLTCTFLNVACREQPPLPFLSATQPPPIVSLLNIVDKFTLDEVNLIVLQGLIRGHNDHGETFRRGRRWERWKKRGRIYKGVGGGGIGIVLPRLGN